MLSRLPVLWKVLLAPAIAMVCMGAYLTFTAIVFEQNNVRLADVRDVQYPVLDALTGPSRRGDPSGRDPRRCRRKLPSRIRSRGVMR